MGKKVFRICFLIMTLLACLWAGTAASADEPSVTLTIGGSTANQTILADQSCRVVVRAPGATGVRLWDPNENEWKYFEEGARLSFLELSWKYGSGTRMVYAQARYDAWPEDVWIGDEAYEEQWTADSNIIRLTARYSNGTLSDPSAALDVSSVTRRDWLTARITQTLGLGEWYWAEVMRQTGNNEFEQVEHYDFNEAGVLHIPALKYAPGNYWLFVYNGCGGYAHGETRLPFTITSTTSLPTGLLTAVDTSPVSTDVFLCGNMPQADHMELQVQKRGDPGWRDHQWWDGSLAQRTWRASDPGIYDLTLTGFSGDEQVMTDTAVITLTAEENGRLQAPDLSGFQTVLGPDDGLAGTVAADPRTKWMNVDMYWCPDGGDWVDIYQADREITDGDDWLEISLPADLFSQSGRYRMDVNTNAPGLGNGYTGLTFLKADEMSEDLTLTVNGQSFTR